MELESKRSFKRYTELPFVLQILQSKTITLLSSASWDDKNDAYYVECYKQKRNLKSVLVLCLTEAFQTYHHWKIFSNGSSGVCIHFKRANFLQWLAETEGLAGGKVIYKNVKQLAAEVEDGKIEIRDIPYIKRKAYRGEEEFRLIFESKKLKNLEHFKFPISMIERIVINPWLPQSTFSSLRLLIRAIDGCEDISVSRATIVANDEWRGLADTIQL